MIRSGRDAILFIYSDVAKVFVSLWELRVGDSFKQHCLVVMSSVYHFCTVFKASLLYGLCALLKAKSFVLCSYTFSII